MKSLLYSCIYFFLVMFLFYLTASKIFFLSFVFSHLKIMCLLVFFFIFAVWTKILFWISESLGSVFCCLSLILENSWPLSLQICFYPFLSSPVTTVAYLLDHLILSHIFWMSVLFHFVLSFMLYLEMPTVNLDHFH